MTAITSIQPEETTVFNENPYSGVCKLKLEEFNVIVEGRTYIENQWLNFNILDTAARLEASANASSNQPISVVHFSSKNVSVYAYIFGKTNEEVSENGFNMDETYAAAVVRFTEDHYSKHMVFSNNQLVMSINNARSQCMGDKEHNVLTLEIPAQ